MSATSCCGEQSNTQTHDHQTNRQHILLASRRAIPARWDQGQLRRQPAGADKRNAGDLPAHFQKDQPMSTNTRNQTNRILRYLRTGRGITPLSALSRFNCMRLAARIEELKDAGIRITSRMMHRNGRRFACYRLA